MLFNNPYNGAFGLDIGDLSIKLVQLKKTNRHYSVSAMQNVALPPGYIVNGEIVQPEMVRKKLLHLLGRDGVLKYIDSPWVVADLPDPKTFLTTLIIDGAPETITEDDVLFQAKKHLPFELSEAYFDWDANVFDGNQSQSQILISATPKIIADSYTFLLESVGLQPIALEAEPIALIRALVDDKNSTTAVANMIIDLGATRSSLSIVENGHIKFNTDIKFSGELINTALMQQLKIDRPVAENLKISYGANYTAKYPRYLIAIEDLLGSLIAEINKSILYYNEHFFNSTPITQIILSGGMANMLNLPNYISQKTGVGCLAGNVWINIEKCKHKHCERGDESSYASALGLALRALRNPYNE